MLKFVKQILLLSLILNSSLYATDATSKSYSVMTFNVENLFDTKHDTGKNDFTFLPKKQKNTKTVVEACNKALKEHWRRQCLNLDWNKKVLQRKMQQIAKIILSTDNGHGPDLLILQEVENIEVLETLRKKYLQAAHYKKSILLEGNDERGIDVAILTRLPIKKASARLHKTNFSGEEEKYIADTREILHVKVSVSKNQQNKWLNVFAVHLPAQHLPARMRETQIKHLNDLVEALAPEEYALAAGDFNISTRDDAKNSFYDLLDDSWDLSHRLGCRKCKGTHYYRRNREWSFLDAILVSPRLGQKIIKSSIKVINNYPGQVNLKGHPERFNVKTLMGFSDHLPLYMRLKSI